MLGYGRDMTLSGRAVWAPLLAFVLLVTGCGVVSTGSADGDGSRDGDPKQAETASPVAAPSIPRVVAVGDIACEPGRPPSGRLCRQAATAGLARRLQPDLVLTLGDHQYDKASLADFQGSYANSWGTLLSKTRPAIGNHEYKTAGAAGYYTYFKSRQPGPPGYYRVVANRWNIYVLNSNCGKVSCARQATWLNRQMAAHPSRCSIITMHHPRYSSGFEHGNNLAVKPLWAAAYQHRNDVVLAGHDHDYERFRPMDGSGHVKPQRGMVGFVAGTGGANLYHLGTRKRGSVYYQGRTPGVLLLSLRSGSFGWSFHSIAGTVMDSGSRSCH
jgi:hypothetical protein